jgi:outer membrane protein assembly factor BamA
LGDHRLQFGTNLFFDLKNSSFYGSYYYLAKQTDYGISAFHTAYSFATDYVAEPPQSVPQAGSDGYADSFVRFRYYGVSLSASRPINKFNRFDVSVTQFTLARETSIDNRITQIYDPRTDSTYSTNLKDVIGIGRSRSSSNTVITAAFTTDNALNTYFGPFDGHRAQVAVTASPGYGPNGLRFATVTADFRKYFWFEKYYAVALRASGGATYGRNPQRFFVGGLDNWIVPRFTNGTILVNAFEDFLATFVSPVRGSDYYELQGTRYLVANLEFRFPLIHFMQLGFPLPLFLQSIRGVTFIDAGAAWGGPPYAYLARNGQIVTNTGHFNLTQHLNGEPGRVFQDARVGYGFGIRAFVGFFILRYDLAWNLMNPRFQGNDVRHYFSIGSDF